MITGSGGGPGDVSVPSSTRQGGGRLGSGCLPEGPFFARVGYFATQVYSGGVNVSWLQREIRLPPFCRGCHPITRQIVDALPELADVEIGLLHVFIRHTSASLSINEDADPDVPVDLDRVLDTLVPEDYPYRHTCEGPDDMPAHVKSSLLGSSLTIPIRGGRLLLGTWQGVYLCEHRLEASGRAVVLTVQGEFRRADGEGLAH